VSRPAVFLDRDGTIIEDVSYPRDPEQIRLLPGAGRAIHRLNTSGLLVLVVTNQSGIARGILSEEDYGRTERRLDELLAGYSARIDAHYFCPHLPELTGPCECRKPGTLLYRQAAKDFDIDLGRSWWVGDRMRDVQPAEALGGRSILVLSEAAESEPSRGTAHWGLQAPDLSGAVKLILKELRIPKSPDT
jgi:D-glycero-D-manno-heptose 1,7-bisphosphate phosphatase